MIVAIEPAGANAGHVEIGPAIVVEIADNATRSPTVVRHTCARGYVSEGAVMVVTEEGRMRWRRLSRQSIQRGPVHQINIEPAVVIVIKKADA